MVRKRYLSIGWCVMRKTIALIITVMALSGCGRCFIPATEHLTGVNIPNEQAIEYPLFYNLPAVVNRYAPQGMEYTFGRFREIDIMRFLSQGKRVVAIVPFMGEYTHALAVHRMSDVDWGDVIEVHITY